MKIAIEFPDQLTENEIEVILDIWNRKTSKNTYLTQLKIIGAITLACAVIPNVQKCMLHYAILNIYILSIKVWEG